MSNKHTKKSLVSYAALKDFLDTYSKEMREFQMLSNRIFFNFQSISYCEEADRILLASICNTIDKITWCLISLIKGEPLQLGYFKYSKVSFPSDWNLFARKYFHYFLQHPEQVRYETFEVTYYDSNYISATLYNHLCGNSWGCSITEEYGILEPDTDLDDICSDELFNRDSYSTNTTSQYYVFVQSRYMDKFYKSLAIHAGAFFPSGCTSDVAAYILQSNVDYLHACDNPPAFESENEKIIYSYNTNINYDLYQTYLSIISGELPVNTPDGPLNLKIFRELYPELSVIADSTILKLLGVSKKPISYMVDIHEEYPVHFVLIYSIGLGYLITLSPEDPVLLELPDDLKKDVLEFKALLLGFQLKDLTLFNENHCHTMELEPTVIDKIFFYGTNAAVSGYTDLRCINLISLTLYEMADNLYNAIKEFIQG